MTSDRDNPPLHSKKEESPFPRMEPTMSIGSEAGAGINHDLESWIEAARRADFKALGRALEPFRNYLLLVANEELEPELRPKLGASDLVQETFLGAQRDIRCFRGRTEREWRLWLRGILRHALANHRRHYRAIVKRRIEREVSISCAPHLDWPAAGASPSANLATREVEAALLAALDRLAEHHRDVVIWHHLERLTFEEVGRRLGISADAARKHWERALKALRKELRASHDIA
jgi:RNA polymerase sigma-70 factor, ECF subfamily